MTDEGKQSVATIADEETPAPSAGAGRRVAYWGVLVLTTVLATVAIFAVWANRQLLNTDNWTETSTKLLQNAAIRDQTATYLTDQLYANVDVQGEIQGFLPKELQPLAAPAAGAVRNVVDDAAGKALQNPTVQQAWSEANRTAHQGLVNVIEDKGTYTSINGNTVNLDLTPILVSIAARLGLPQAVQSRIPPDAAKVQVLESDQLSTAQSVAKGLKASDWFLRLLVVLGFGLAIWLAKGRRSQALMASGIGLVVAGLAALIIRGIAGGAVVNDLAATEAVRPAAEAAWDIGTELLTTLAWSTVFVGIPAIIVGMLLGPYEWAKALRARMAGVAYDRPEFLYGGAVLIVLFLIIWEPVPATRRLLTILVFLAVIVGGTYALRRRILEENPDRELALAGGGAGIKERAAGVAASVKSAVSRPPAEGGDDVTDRMARLERLVALRDGGALSDAEFEAEKAKLMGAGDGT